MSNKDECFSCANLIQHRKQINVKRKDGNYETAAWFTCKASDRPLPTITKYDLPGCAYWVNGERIIVNHE